MNSNVVFQSSTLIHQQYIKYNSVCYKDSQNITMHCLKIEILLQAHRDISQRILAHMGTLTQDGSEDNIVANYMFVFFLSCWSQELYIVLILKQVHIHRETYIKHIMKTYPHILTDKLWSHYSNRQRNKTL